jgi:hypothetical protein
MKSDYSGFHNNIPLREGWWTESERVLGGKATRLTYAYNAFNSPAVRVNRNVFMRITIGENYERHW